METIFGVHRKAENNYHAVWPVTLSTSVNKQFQKTTIKYYYNFINEEENIN